MEKLINEETLICITKENNQMKLIFIDFDENPLKNSYDFIEMKKLLKEGIDWYIARDKGYDSFVNIKNKFPNFFHEEEVLTKPYEPYARESTIGINTLVKKKMSKNNNRKFYIFYKDEDHAYGLTSLIDKLELTFTHYLYKKAVQTAEKLHVLAYSHRIAGWNTIPFVLDNDFKISIDTNFGYGGSSYFLLKLIFRDIPIIPYTKLIYYQYVNASSILHYTQNYSVDFNSWKLCYTFVVNEINDYCKTSKDSFIHKHIVTSLNELMELLEKIMKTDVFYFVDISKLDSFLNLNGKNIIYDYEHFFNNVNKEIIDEIALKKLVEKYENLSFYYNFDSKTEKMLDELASFVLNVAKSEIDVDLNRERYGYAIAMLLSKYSNKYESWQNITDEVYSERIQVIVKRILNLDKNYTLLLYKKSGIDLLVFRNERIQIATQLFDNIKGLGAIINSNHYISQIRKNVLAMVNQNNEYLINIEPSLLKAKEEFEKYNQIYLNEKALFENTVEYIQICFYNNFLDSLRKLIKAVKSKPENQNEFTFEDTYNSNLDELIKNISNLESQGFLNVNQVFILDGYGNNESNGLWSIKKLRERYFKSSKDEDKLALDKLLNIVKRWHDLVLIFKDSKDVTKINCCIKEGLRDIKNISSELNELVPNHSSLLITFDIYKESYFANQSHYLSVKPAYDEKIKVINELKSNALKYEQIFQEINNNKESILEFNRILEVSICG